mgnify:FL=1
MLVTVCEYEQNPSRGVGRVAHKIFRDVRMHGRTYVRAYGQMDGRTDGKVQILMPTHYFVCVWALYHYSDRFIIELKHLK